MPSLDAEIAGLSSTANIRDSIRYPYDNKGNAECPERGQEKLEAVRLSGRCCCRYCIGVDDIELRIWTVRCCR